MMARSTRPPARRRPRFRFLMPFSWLIMGIALLAGCARTEREQWGSLQIQFSPSIRSEVAQVIQPPSGLIVYIGQDGNVYTVDQHGTQRTQITSEGNLRTTNSRRQEGETLVFHTLPTWSPAEQRLVFSQISTHLEEGRRESISRSFTAFANGDDLQELSVSSLNNIYYYWAPTGNQVAALTIAPGNQLKLDQLRPDSIGIDGEETGDQPPVFDIGQPFYFDWAPHGRQMVVHIGANQVREKIAILALAKENGSATDHPTQQEEVLALDPARFNAPDWSPDGQSILMSRYSVDLDDDDTLLVSRDLSTRADQVIAKYDGDVRMSAGWSSNNRYISFIPSQETERTIGRLFVVDFLTKEEISTQHANIVAYFWSPDGSQIAYFTFSDSIDEASPSTVDSDRHDRHGAGYRFVQHQTEEDETEERFGLYVLDVATGNTTTILESFLPTQNFLSDAITFFDQYQRSATIWSPDNRYIVLPLQGDTGGEIWVYHAQGRFGPTQVANGLLAYWSFR